MIQATTLPAGCLQYVPGPFRGIVTTEVTAADFQRGDYSNTTEDCLALSVFAPGHPPRGNASKDSPGDELLPVLIWVHGGGFSFGGTNVPFQQAQSWVERSQKHIVVQIQYRLNLLGVPNAAGLVESGENLNLALLDQHLAVEWVRDNIAAFGGDPERISLWGESAGAYAVDAYLFSYAEDPIIKGAIADSGNALAIPGVLLDENDHSVFSLAASKLGCENLSPSEELECMRNVPESEIQGWLQTDIGEGGAVDENIMFGAIADNVTFFKSYEDRIKAGKAKFASDIPLLIGTNTEEGHAVVPYNFPGSETATELPDDLQVISQGFGLNLQCTTLRETRLRAEAGAVTYQYLYAGNFTNISPRPWLGAYHTAELPLVFGTHAMEGPSTEFEQQVSENMQDLWLEFIMDPTEGLKRAGWPQATSQSEDHKLVELAADGELKQVISIKRLKDECVNNGYEV